MPLQQSKRIEDRMPDRETPYGRAWRCDLKKVAEHLGAGGVGATVCAWIIEAPWAHPLWANYALMAMHLRSTAELPDPKIVLDGATHEMLLVALDPGKTPCLLAPMQTRLTPANFGAQWIAASDIDADSKIERCVEEIMAGTLSPDTDFIRDWIARFNGSLLKH